METQEQGIMGGNENTKFFHKYANYRKNINSIWKTDKRDGTWDTNFKNIALGAKHFSSLFKENTCATIAEVIRLSTVKLLH